MRYKLQHIWETFRYSIPGFFRALWVFRKALWNYRWYGGHHSVFPLMSAAIKDMHVNIEERGIEELISKGKKVEAMKRCVYLLDLFADDGFVDAAEKELGLEMIFRNHFEPLEDRPELYVLVEDLTEEEKKINERVLRRAHDMQKKGWKELMHLLSGQNYSKFKKEIEFLDQFDGSGIRGWWD
jgi:hypothetical protein